MDRNVDDFDMEMIKEMFPKLQRDVERLHHVLDFFEYCIANYKAGEANEEIVNKLFELEEEGNISFEAAEIL